MVPTRPLGQTGLIVSAIGLGTVKIGRASGVKYPAPFDLPKDAQVVELLNIARSLGVNCIDTAPAYGSSERRLGALLPTPRDQWILATKTGEHFDGHKSTFDFSYDATIASVTRSLQHLKTHFLDLVSVHSDGRDEHIIHHEGALDALHDLKQRGLVRAVGMSVKSVSGGLLAVDHCDVVMVSYNPLDTAAAAVIEKADRNKVGILIKKALLGGHLQTIDDPDPVDACIRMALDTPGVSSVIIGTLDPDHLRSAVQSARRTVDR